jgi:formate hydrogenlyase subunit 6/NADH:ubiquinone oxidoreductase subunit I
MCDAILTGERKYKGGDPVSRLGGWFQRLTNDVSFYKYQENLQFDRERCTRCMLCYQMCPTGNIHLDQDGELQFGTTCIFCLKCYNLCPNYATLIGEGSRDYEKYRRYKGPSPEVKPVVYRR